MKLKSLSLLFLPSLLLSSCNKSILIEEIEKDYPVSGINFSINTIQDDQTLMADYYHTITFKPIEKKNILFNKIEFSFSLTDDIEFKPSCPYKYNEVGGRFIYYFKVSKPMDSITISAKYYDCYLSKNYSVKDCTIKSKVILKKDECLTVNDNPNTGLIFNSTQEYNDFYLKNIQSGLIPYQYLYLSPIFFEKKSLIVLSHLLNITDDDCNLHNVFSGDKLIAQSIITTQYTYILFQTKGVSIYASIDKTLATNIVNEGVVIYEKK